MNETLGTPVSRRGFLGQAALGSAVAATLSTPAVIGSARAADEEISLFSWETYSEDDWVNEWSKQNGVRVNVTRTGSIDEMYAKIKSGAVQPDLIYIDTGTFQRYIDMDLLVPIDLSKIPNAKNISPAIHYQSTNVINGKLYAVPYDWGPLPMMYRVDVVKEGRDTWKTMWDPKHAGRVSIPDDAYMAFQMVGIVAGAVDPYNLTDAEFKTCTDLFRALRPQIKTLTKGNNDTQAVFASGDVDVGLCMDFSIVVNLQKDGKNVDYSLPKEGTPSWLDCTSMTKKGSREIVYKYLDATMSLPWQRRMIELNHNPGVLDVKTAASAGLSPEFLAGTYMALLDQPGFWETLKLTHDPNNMDRRLQIWNDFKAGSL